MKKIYDQALSICSFIRLENGYLGNLVDYLTVAVSQ